MGQDPTQHCHTLASRRFLARTLKCVCPVVPRGSSIVLQVCCEGHLGPSTAEVGVAGHYRPEFRTWQAWVGWSQ